MGQIPRTEYPRPQFVREPWLNLNGPWRFAFDDLNEGISEKWYQLGAFAAQINVPFAYQTILSGINLREQHDIVWYAREFDLPVEMQEQSIRLHFGAVDYMADVWVNGAHVATHQGGHISFEMDISNIVNMKNNTIVVRAQDYHAVLTLPRGKQYWKVESESIFYTATTGIWQSVWVEAIPSTYLKHVWFTPDLDRRSIDIEFATEGNGNISIASSIYFKGKHITTDTAGVVDGLARRSIGIQPDISFGWDFIDSMAWSPEHPYLFDVTFELMLDDVVVDRVTSYFAMRKVSIVDGHFMLNNRQYYQKMLLDQGYWEPSLLTAPTDEDFVKDITLCKEMGFNGVRKHQKVEDPRFLYWADRMGLLVWGEMANAYVYSRDYAALFVAEWLEVLKRDYNHPCIVAWVPLNESWGVDQIMNSAMEQNHADSLYHLTKSIDATRPVISNDGWEHTKTDLHTIHDYSWRKDILINRYKNIDGAIDFVAAGRAMFAQNYRYGGQPVIISECGGIAFGQNAGWGYSTAQTKESLLQRFEDVISAFYACPLVQGFCYTQLTDVEQEINGLLTYGRVPKVDTRLIKKVMDGK